MLYLFGDFEFHTDELQLRRGETLVPLEPKAYKVLDLLLRHRDRVVRKDELLETVWQGAQVDEAAIRRTVRALRRALGDEGSEERFISTRHGIGYRFIAAVQERPNREDPPVVTISSEPVELPTPPDTTDRYSFLRTASLLDLTGTASKIASGPAVGGRMPVFLDDSYLLALAVRDHAYHLRALELAEWLQTESRPIVTTESVLERFRAAFRNSRFNEASATQLENALLNDPAVQIIGTSKELLEAVIDGYWGSARQHFTASECICFVVMERHGTLDALSDNEAFHRAGFRALLREPSRHGDTPATRRKRLRSLILYLLPLVSFAPIVLIFLAERIAGEQSIVLRILQGQPAAALGIPTAVLVALGITMFFQTLTREEIRIEVFGLRVSGPAAFLLVWISCFLTIVLAVFLLWTGR